MHLDDLFWILLIYAGVSPLITLCLSIMAFRRSSVLRGEVAALRLRIISLGEAPEPKAEPAQAESPIEPLPDESAAPPEPAEAPIEAPEPSLPEPPPPAEAPATPPTLGWEQRLASRWMLWLGGIALALGGAFLVKVTIDAGLLTPALRCALGILLGLGLAIGGEVLRRKPRQLAIAAIASNHLPTAMSAAGIASLFASIYAAYGLYAMIPAGLAFLLLAGTAFAAVGLSLLQGPFLAGLGLLGGFLTPFIVQTSTPAALPLFALLIALTLAALALARYRGWTWLAASALAGAIGWAVLWTGAFWQSGDGMVFGLYLLALAAASVGFRYGLILPLPGAARFSPERRTGGLRAELKSLDPLVSLAALGILFNAFFLLRHDHYSIWSLVVLGVMAAFYTLSGRRTAALTALPWLAAGTVLASLAFWHLPQIIQGAAPLLVLDGQPIASPRQPIVPPLLLTFTVVSALYALLFAALGYAFLWGARRPGAWAGFSAGLPLTILVIAYWRIAHFEVSLSWAALALVIGGLALWAAERARRAGPSLKGALGAFAVAVVAAVALAATMELREAWLTVALSMMLPAIAWIDSRLELAALRATAFAVAAAVIVRLVLNQTLLGGSPLGHPLFNWLLYGYGLPVLAFAAASLIFRRRADDGLVALLESGALFFLTLLISFEIRSLFNAGDIGARSYELAEQATMVLAWLGLATSLLFVNRRHLRPVLALGWKVLGVWGLGHLALGPLVFANPLFTGAAVGPWPLFNLLGLAYLVPAALIALFAWLAARQGETLAARIAAVAILGLVFVDLSLEVRHGFHGTRLDLGHTTTAEWYAYSLAWLAYAGCLLGLGLRFGQAALRHAGLALLSLVVLKVFLFDMATLTGLYRALSFLGLGASLVAIGYLYQRLFFPPKATTPEGEQAKILGKS